MDNDQLLRRHGLQVTAPRLTASRAVYDALAAGTDKGFLRRVQPARSPACYQN